MRLKLNYKKKSNFSGLNILAFIISAIFLIWSIFAFLGMLWNFGTNWMGFVWLGLSIVIFFGQIGSITARKASKMVFHELVLNPNDSLEEIAQNTGIPLKNVKEIVVDLKYRGILKKSFNTQTGHMENAQLVSPVATASPIPIAATTLSQPSIQSYAEHEEIEFPTEKPRYCSYCGTALNPDVSKYCEFCGQAL